MGSNVARAATGPAAVRPCRRPSVRRDSARSPVRVGQHSRWQAAQRWCDHSGPLRPSWSAAQHNPMPSEPMGRCGHNSCREAHSQTWARGRKFSCAPDFYRILVSMSQDLSCIAACEPHNNGASRITVRVMRVHGNEGRGPQQRCGRRQDAKSALRAVARSCCCC